MDDLWKIVPAVGWMWWPHVVQVHDWRCCVVSYRLNARSCSHFGQSACTPSGGEAGAPELLEAGVVVGNSLMNSMR